MTVGHSIESIYCLEQRSYSDTHRYGLVSPNQPD